MSGITATRLLALAVMAIFFWPQPADAAAWYSTPGWRYRKSITVHSAQVPNTDQSGFPVLINLATDSGLSAHAQTSGNDILFTSVMESRRYLTSERNIRVAPGRWWPGYGSRL